MVITPEARAAAAHAEARRLGFAEHPAGYDRHRSDVQ